MTDKTKDGEAEPAKVIPIPESANRSRINREIQERQKYEAELKQIDPNEWAGAVNHALLSLRKALLEAIGNSRGADKTLAKWIVGLVVAVSVSIILGGVCLWIILTS